MVGKRHLIRATAFPYQVKDLIETHTGLVFAVISAVPHSGKVAAYLRYHKTSTGWQKLATSEATALIKQSYPQYAYHCPASQAHYHAVPIEDIVRHYCPEKRLQQLLQTITDDPIVLACQALMRQLFKAGIRIHQLGVTGSLLLGCQRVGSDIDLAVYGRSLFYATRQAVKQAVKNGTLSALDESAMRDNYHRRQPSLDYMTFAWHEARKWNKAVVKGVKFDIGMVTTEEVSPVLKHYQKQAEITLIATVIEDKERFDFPAQYQIRHQTIQAIVSYSHSYVGQAKAGEVVEAKGVIEYDTDSGQQRLLVGQDREAAGHYIKVLTSP